MLLILFFAMTAIVAWVIAYMGFRRAAGRVHCEVLAGAVMYSRGPLLRQRRSYGNAGLLCRHGNDTRRPVPLYAAG